MRLGENYVAPFIASNPIHIIQIVNIRFAHFCHHHQNSEIYTTPRLTESLENAVSFGSANCISNVNNIGTINSNNFNTSSTNGSSSLNNVHSQKHRIDALTSISTPVSGSTTVANHNGTSSHSGLSQTMDTIVDAKLRQGDIFILYCSQSF